MNGHARAFRITIWTGVLVNFAVALTGLFAPDWLLRTLGFDVAYPNLWPRFACWLLMLLSIAYIPGANDLNRYRANALLAVGARWSGVVFFLAAVLLIRFEVRYLLFGLLDFVFAVPGSFFLWMAIRRQKEEQARQEAETKALRPRTIGVTHVAAAEEVARTR